MLNEKETLLISSPEVIFSSIENDLKRRKEEYDSYIWDSKYGKLPLYRRTPLAKGTYSRFFFLISRRISETPFKWSTLALSPEESLSQLLEFFNLKIQDFYILQPLKVEKEILIIS